MNIAPFSYPLLGLSALLVGLGVETDTIPLLATGLATAIVNILYVLVMHALIIQPLITRVERGLTAQDSEPPSTSKSVQKNSSGVPE